LVISPRVFISSSRCAVELRVYGKYDVAGSFQTPWHAFMAGGRSSLCFSYLRASHRGIVSLAPGCSFSLVLCAKNIALCCAVLRFIPWLFSRATDVFAFRSNKRERFLRVFWAILPLTASPCLFFFARSAFRIAPCLLQALPPFWLHAPPAAYLLCAGETALALTA
jgi:hypothetical protein